MRDPKPKVVSEGWCADQFAKRYADELLFSEDEPRWYRWTGSLWRRQRLGLARDLAHELAKQLGIGADNRPKMGAAAFAAAVAKIVSDKEAFARQAHHWDQAPFLAGSPELTLNLEDGDLRAADPADMITKSLGVAPHFFPLCPRWLRFLDEATGGDAELILFLQRWCGYCLTGDTREHALVFIFGPGGNGKTVFQNIVSFILGDYAVTAPMDTFTVSPFDKHPTELAMLRGARLVTASETEENRIWNESRIKQLTGGDPISARFMRQDFFTFRPTFKLMVAGNHQPILQNVDEALRRRFCMVPFTRKPENPDPKLEQALKAEAAGILRWMINGCLDWQAHGLPRPASVIVANEEFFSDQDNLGQWIEEETRSEPGNEFLWEPIAKLFASYSAFAKRAGEDPGKSKGFVARMLRRGYLRKRVNVAKCLSGLELVTRKVNENNET